MQCGRLYRLEYTCHGRLKLTVCYGEESVSETYGFREIKEEMGGVWTVWNGSSEYRF